MDRNPPDAPRRKPLSTTEFQAVILASVSDGDQLSPLTNTQPLGLLPVANRPLISYQLELLARSHSFKQVLVVATEGWQPQLATWVADFAKTKGSLQIELVQVPNGSGSADSLRHIREKLTTDFVVLAGDVITDVPFQRMADLHRLQGAAVTALFREGAPREAGVAKKARDLDGIDFVGVDERSQRLLSLEAAADCDNGVVSVSQSMLRVYPHVTLRTDLIDAHVYIFAHWVLDVLELKPHFSSAKFELVPYLVRKQFLSKDNLAKMRGERASDDAPADSDEAAAALWGKSEASASALAMSAGRAARQHNSESASDFSCYCYLMAHDASYCMRTGSLKEYMQANLDVSRESCPTQYAKAEQMEAPNNVKGGQESNFVHRSRDKDSTLGREVEVGGRSAIKKSCIGSYCVIGSGVKITNCVLHDGVVVGDKVNMTNSIVCEKAEVREGASLKDAYVAAGVTVEANAVHKGEVVTMQGDDMDED